MSNVMFDPSMQFQQPDYRIKIPSMQSIPEGYAYAGTDEYGSLMSAPERSEFNRLKKFSENLFDPSIATRSAGDVKFLNDEAYSTLNAIGVTKDPSKGDNFRTIGMNSVGDRLFSAQKMTTSGDYQLGVKMIKSATDLIKAFEIPTGHEIFDESELLKFKDLSDKSQNPQVIQALDDSRNANDSEGFMDLAVEFFGGDKPKVTKKGQKDGKGVKGDEKKSKLMDSLGTAYQAFSLYETWDYLSPAQKAAGLATLGIKSYDLATGEKLGKKVLVDATHKADGSELTPALTVETAMDMFSAGINAYGLAKNWDQLSDLSKIVSGVRTAKSMARVAKGFNLLGSGTKNAATAINTSAMASAGFKSTPHLGVGVLTGPASAGVPKGYTAVTYTDDLLSSTQGGKNVVIVPEANANTAQGVSSNSGSTLNTAIQYGSLAASGYSAYRQYEQGDKVGAGLSGAQTAVGAYNMYTTGSISGASAGGAGAGIGAGQAAAGALGIAAGAYQLYQGWGTGGSEGATNGALGGASMAAGLYALGATNPFLLAGVVVVAALSGMIKTGKHGDQVDRDAVRSRFKEIGFVDDEWNVELADGSKYDIGIDGRGGQHDFLNPDMVDKHGGDSTYKLGAYDVDYTNDVSYMASLGGVSLSRLINGGAAKNVDQMGGQLTNAMISNVDFADGKLTEDKYNKIMENQRAMYTQAGVKSKSDAYALANQMYAEGRIDDFQLVQMHQSFNMMYDANSYEYAMTLNEGRWKGIEVANEKKDVSEKDKVTVGGRGRPTISPTKEEEEEDQIAA